MSDWLFIGQLVRAADKLKNFKMLLKNIFITSIAFFYYIFASRHGEYLQQTALLLDL